MSSGNAYPDFIAQARQLFSETCEAKPSSFIHGRERYRSGPEITGRRQFRCSCFPGLSEIVRKRKDKMKNVRRLAVRKMLFAVLGVSVLFTAIAQAQLGIPIFTGKFKLTTQVMWGETVLRPGEYTITITSMSSPVVALISDGSGRPVARFMGGIDDGKTSTRNVLLVRKKGGQMRVYALALAGQKKVLVYNRVLAQEAAIEARAPQTVSVMLAKR